MRSILFVRLLVGAALFSFGALRTDGQIPVAASSSGSESTNEAKVSYQLPIEGPLPKTYRVTLAAVDPKDPRWVISTFAAGLVRTVTAQNQGKFTEKWDGLDDNFMPVPPGNYALKGIYMPAQPWPIDGQYHTIIPKLAATGCSWGQSPAQDARPGKIEGDPVGSPMSDVDLQPNGKGVVYFQYLENGTNAFLTDFTRPIDYNQIITGYASGGIGGGGSACTDGRQIWILGDSGQQFILHADGTPFGKQRSLYCNNVYLPESRVTGLSAWRDPELGHGVLFIAENGKLAQSHSDPSGQLVALDGDDASALARWKLEGALAVKVRGGRLYVLHGGRGRYEVESLPLDANWKHARFVRVFAVPAGITPFDVEIDSHHRVYLSDSAANHVYQFDYGGRLLKRYGRLDAQREGAYDKETFMAPEKLACWTDAQGQDRLLVVEQAGPNRLSEWSGDDGRLLRQWVVPQTQANNGYALDPRDPDLAYLLGQRYTIVRWKIDYATGQWTTDAVWSRLGSATDDSGRNFFRNLAYPRLIYRGNDAYLAFGRGYALFHLEGNRLRACDAVLRLKTDQGDRDFLWQDRNGDGEMQANEYQSDSISAPPGVLQQYFGDNWFDDLSLVCIGSGTPDIWKLAPNHFDRRGTPIFDPNAWKKLLTDNIFVARKAGTATALRGGNELLSGGFDSAWASVAKGPGGEVYVDARSGPDFSSNLGAQFKLSRYDPDERGGYVQRWRVGRMAFQGNARPGEVYGSIYVCPPINGLVGIVDSARAGMEIYTTDGLYVDTLFPDAQVVGHDQMGAYWQPGEYFSGSDYLNREDGKVYLALGKTMPRIYAAQGWTATENQVHPLTTLDRSVTISAGQIAAPPQLALQIRGGPAAARVAEFSPAPGGSPTLDGSMRGWEGCDPVAFGPGPDQGVEVRCLYDPEHLYLRWHVRTAHSFAAKTLPPLQHIFAHDRGNDTLGFYLQGDPHAAAGAQNPGGRPGDVRFVFGLFKEAGSTHPVVVGMYPTWTGRGATPVSYTTPVGSAHFANVGLVPGVIAGYELDSDHHGFVLAASIPRAAIPGGADLTGWHTEGNFDANLGGVDRFWWSNADGSASRETFDEPTEARLYPGSWSPVQFLPIGKLPIHSWMAIGPFGFARLPKLDGADGRLEIISTLTNTTYPPDTTRDMSATYNGTMTQTRAARRKVAWRDVEISADNVDFEKALDWPGAVGGVNDEGVAFLWTHIYTPKAAVVTLNVPQPYGDHDISGLFNGEALPGVSQNHQQSLDLARPLSLHAGWNELLLRYTYVWGDHSLGASLTARPAILWKLKISGPPSAQP